MRALVYIYTQRYVLVRDIAAIDDDGESHTHYTISAQLAASVYIKAKKRAERSGPKTQESRPLYRLSAAAGLGYIRGAAVHCFELRASTIVPS